jgi:TolA-binding protein
MGDVYFARKDYELAIKFYGSVINVAKERKNTQLETDMKIKIGKAFYAKGEKDTATAFWGVSFTLE